MRSCIPKHPYAMTDESIPSRRNHVFGLIGFVTIAREPHQCFRLLESSWRGLQIVSKGSPCALEKSLLILAYACACSVCEK